MAANFASPVRISAQLGPPAECSWNRTTLTSWGRDLRRDRVLRCCDAEKSALHRPVYRTEDVAIDSELPKLIGDEGHMQDLAGDNGNDAAVVVMGHLEAVCLEVGVTHRDVHSLTLRDVDYRP